LSSKKEVPEWIKQSRAYRLLAEAAEQAFTEGCDCNVCKTLREWANLVKDLPGAPGREAVRGGRREGS